MMDFMRKTFLGLAAVVALGVSGASAAPFVFNANGGNGTGVDNGPVGAFDFAVTLTSNNNGASDIFTTATTLAAVNSSVTGVWTYITNDKDGSSFDPFGYFIDSVFVTLVQLSTSGIPAPAIQSGTFSFSVLAGQDFGFYNQNFFGALGSSTGVAYGDIIPAAVPVPAAGLLLLAALGGLTALRRRKSV